MINWIAGALGGVLVVAVPIVCLRLFGDEGMTRTLIVVIALSAGAVFILGLLLASQKVLVAIVFAIASGSIWDWRFRSSGVDFTVEGPLLGDSVAPELEAQLAAVEAEEAARVNHPDESEQSDPHRPSF